MRIPSALVFEADLDLDVVLDDLAVLDDRGRLHDLYRHDVADGLRCGRDGLARGVAPRARARADHLADDDDAHGCLLLTLDSVAHDDTRPTRFRAGLVAAQEIRADRLGGWRLGKRACPNLVEAGAAIDGSIVPRRAGYDGLTPAGPADRRMELSWSLVRAGALGGCPARRAPLRVVGQTLAGKEGLLAGREAELLGAVATGQTTVLVHPLQTLLPRCGTPWTHEIPTPSGQRVVGGVHEVGCAPVRPGSEPGTHSGEDTRAVKPFGPISQPDAARGTIRTGRTSRRHVEDVAPRG